MNRLNNQQMNTLIKLWMNDWINGEGINKWKDESKDEILNACSIYQSINKTANQITNQPINQQIIFQSTNRSKKIYLIKQGIGLCIYVAYSRPNGWNDGLKFFVDTHGWSGSVKG